MIFRAIILCMTLSTWAIDVRAAGWVFGVGHAQCARILKELKNPNPEVDMQFQIAIGAWAAGAMSAFNALNGLEAGRGVEEGIFDLIKAECIKNPEWDIFRAVLQVYGDLRD